MRKIVILFTLLLVSVMTTACISNMAIEELNNKAEQYLEKGDAESAICRLKSSLDLDNELYQTHYKLALAYNKAENYEGAAEELAKVLELRPDYDEVLLPLAEAKNAIALKILKRKGTKDFNSNDIVDFNANASEAIEYYNKYLVKNVSAKNTNEINAKIETLNDKIKEFSLTFEPEKQDFSEYQEETTEEELP